MISPSGMREVTDEPPRRFRGAGRSPSHQLFSKHAGCLARQDLRQPHEKHWHAGIVDSRLEVTAGHQTIDVRTIEMTLKRSAADHEGRHRLQLQRQRQIRVFHMVQHAAREAKEFAA